MVKLSNSLVGVLNIITFLLSIPIIAFGIWLTRKGTTECEKFLDTPIILIGAFLLLVSLAGLIGACCRVKFLLWIYLVVMFILILALIILTVFVFVVTNKGAGKALSNRGYKQYRLGDYSNWLRNRIENEKNWNRIKSCLIDSHVCEVKKLSPVQEGCCEPAKECNLLNVGPVQWIEPVGSGNWTNPDCGVWKNGGKNLCLDCKSCKGEVLNNLKRNWKKVSFFNIGLVVFLILVYSVGCCALKNNKKKKLHCSRW